MATSSEFQIPTLKYELISDLFIIVPCDYGDLGFTWSRK